MHDAAAGGNLEMASKMLETGKFELGIRNKEGRTALDLAKRRALQQVVDLLTQYGAGEWAYFTSHLLPATYLPQLHDRHQHRRR